MEHETKPIVRRYKEKTKAGALTDRTREKEEMIEQHLESRRMEQQLIEKYIRDDKIHVKQLPIIEASVRKMMLTWIGKAMGKKDRVIKTELGRRVKVVMTNERIMLRAEDGDLEMPNATFLFLTEKEAIE